jgi:hypothetical protein
MPGTQKHRGFIRDRKDGRVVKTRSALAAEKDKWVADMRKNMRDLTRAYDILLLESEELKNENEVLVFKMMRMEGFREL